jgi:hypothetical protein
VDCSRGEKRKNAAAKSKLCRRVEWTLEGTSELVVVVVHVTILVPIPVSGLDMEMVAVPINLTWMVVPMARIVPAMRPMPTLRRVVRPVLVTSIVGSLAVTLVVAVVMAVVSSAAMGIANVDVNSTSSEMNALGFRRTGASSSKGKRGDDGHREDELVHGDVLRIGGFAGERPSEAVHDDLVMRAPCQKC